MLRLLSSSCVRTALITTDVCFQHYSVKYGVTVPWRSVQRFSPLMVGSAGPVRNIGVQGGRFPESEPHGPRRRQKSKESASSAATNIPNPEHDHAFGEYSSEYANRMTFKKTSPQYQDLRYNEEGEEKRPPKFKSRTGQRNTPYWYFLQCKKLIKQDQVK